MTYPGLPKEIIVPELMDPPARPRVSLAKAPLPEPAQSSARRVTSQPGELRPLTIADLPDIDPKTLVPASVQSPAPQRPSPGPKAPTPKGSGKPKSAPAKKPPKKAPPARKPRRPTNDGRGLPRPKRIKIADQFLAAGDSGTSGRIRKECAEDAMAEISDRFRRNRGDLYARNVLELCARAFENGRHKGKPAAPFFAMNGMERDIAEHWAKEGLFIRSQSGFQSEFALTIEKYGQVAHILLRDNPVPAPRQPAPASLPPVVTSPAPQTAPPVTVTPHQRPAPPVPPTPLRAPVPHNRSIPYLLGAFIRRGLTRTKTGSFSTTIREFLEGLLGDP